MLDAIHAEETMLGEASAADGRQRQHPADHRHPARNQRAAQKKVVGEYEDYHEQADRAEYHQRLVAAGVTAGPGVKAAELKYEQSEEGPEQPVVRNESLECCGQIVGPRN